MCSPKVEIKSIIYIEFDASKGPKITYQIPKACISNQEFGAFCIYIIPKTDLHNRLITINTGEHKILGCPVGIYDDKKYNHRRNELLFNMCFVFDNTAQPQCYENAVKKLSQYLMQLEIDINFLSKEENIVNLPNLMTDIFESLNKNGHCSINTRGCNTIHLKVSPCLTDLPVIQDYDVPIIITDTALVDTGQWDLTTQQVLPYLNGLNHVTRVASESDIEVNLVKACVQNLLHYKVVKIIQIFQYGNMYTTTPEINTLMESDDLRDECVSYVTRAGCSPPRFHDVFTLFCALVPGTTVKDLCSRHNPSFLRIDEQKLIQFGLLKDLIRRLEKYPFKVMASSSSGQLDHWMTGHHSYDEVCCKTGFSNQYLDAIIETDPTIMVLWK